MFDPTAIDPSIPVIDLHDWRSGDDERRAHFVGCVGDALREVGFFALAQHGVEPHLVEDAYRQTEALFGLPDDARARCVVDGARGQRGYTGFGRERAKDVDAPDLKSFWQFGCELPAEHPLAPVYDHNVWPAEVPDARRVIVELWQKLQACAVDILEACALYAGESIDIFREMVRDGDSVLRLIEYPPIPADAPDNSMRAAAHEDINLITLMVESTASGLEILTRDGHWQPVHDTGGHLIVDSGDILRHVTNGLFTSTTHRVVNPADRTERRLSMPFYVHPRADVDLSPRSICVGRTGGVPHFPACTARELLDSRLRDNGLG